MPWKRPLTRLRAVADCAAWVWVALRRAKARPGAAGKGAAPLHPLPKGGAREAFGPSLCRSPPEGSQIQGFRFKRPVTPAYLLRVRRGFADTATRLYTFSQDPSSKPLVVELLAPAVI